MVSLGTLGPKYEVPLRPLGYAGHSSPCLRLDSSGLPRVAPKMIFTFIGAKSGGDGDRTHDPELAKLVLSQLSYAPEKSLEGEFVARESHFRHLQVTRPLRA